MSGNGVRRRLEWHLAAATESAPLYQQRANRPRVEWSRGDTSKVFRRAVGLSGKKKSRERK